jgi:lipocalin-like protein
MTRFRVFYMPKLVVAALILGAVLTAHAPAQTVTDLVGTWTWVSIEGTRPDGTKYQPFGASPKGHIVFDANGGFAFLLTEIRDQQPRARYGRGECGRHEG